MIELRQNPRNPRSISKDEFVRLKAKLKEFPEMLEKRPIVYDENMIILGGNMRYRALRELQQEGFEVKDSYFVSANGWTQKQKDRFVINDNVSDGEWDYDVLANEWDSETLDAWGVEVPSTAIDDTYTQNIKIPVYEATSDKPETIDLVETTKTDELINEIESANVSTEIKNFLKIASCRHYVFNYSKIADFYAHADKDVQELMERSALVIIDIDKAIENGFAELTAFITEASEQDNA